MRSCHKYLLGPQMSRQLQLRWLFPLGYGRRGDREEERVTEVDTQEVELREGRVEQGEGLEDEEMVGGMICE